MSLTPKELPHEKIKLYIQSYTWIPTPIHITTKMYDKYYGKNTSQPNTS